MKKSLLKAFAFVSLGLLATSSKAQVRYIDPVFTAVQRTNNVEYDSNASVNILYGQVPGLQPLFSHKLKCDIYEPAGDVSVNRPLILLAHTGSYLPAVVNKQTTGNRNDSALVEVATNLARRGYVVATVEYRSGWNPQTTVQAIAREQLLKATYRGMQDMRNAVRFFRSHAAMYKIDTSKIVLGGQGTGGYITLAYATVDTREDIESNIKFLRGDGSPMVNMDTLGDWRGAGGMLPYVYSGDPTVSSDVDMVFNFGGAMGDTAWMKSTSLPMISLHCKGDQFAPFKTGNVLVPTTGSIVIPNASGGGDVIPKANAMGLNNKMLQVRYIDGVSLRAEGIAGGAPNLFPFETSFPFEGAPWEWWDRTAMQSVVAVPYAGSPMAAPLYGNIPANGKDADSLSMLTNPFMTAPRGKAYCDTIVRFVSPRIAMQLDLTGTVALNGFNLLTPANNSNLNIYQDSAGINYTISWEKSAATGAQAMSTIYYWTIDLATGDFSNPLFQIPVIDGTSITLSNDSIFNLLSDLGIQVGQTANLKWTVIASNDYFERMAIAPFNVNITLKDKLNGVQKVDYSNFVKVYPNPATSNIQVSINEAKSPISELVVMDIAGREVARYENINSFNQNISLNGFGSGMYFVNLKTVNGGIASKRFIVQ